METGYRDIIYSPKRTRVNTRITCTYTQSTTTHHTPVLFDVWTRSGEHSIYVVFTHNIRLIQIMK